jgi:hypothetical protein
MSVKRVYEGESPNGKWQEALEKAIQLVAKDVGEGGVRDGRVSWIVTETSGEYGGIAGGRSVKVTITGTRVPSW